MRKLAEKKQCKQVVDSMQMNLHLKDLSGWECVSDKLYRNIHCCKTVYKLIRYKLTVQVDSVKYIPISTKSIVANCSKVMTLAPSLLLI